MLHSHHRGEFQIATSHLFEHPPGRGSETPCPIEVSHSSSGDRVDQLIGEKEDVPPDPQIVKKRQRRLTGVDEIVLTLTPEGLTTGEISTYFADVYGATVSKDAINVKVRDGKVPNRPVHERRRIPQCPLPQSDSRPTEQVAMKCL